MGKKINYGYSIEPRPADLGGGWRLRLLENGEEVGGGVFPLSTYLSESPANDEANEREWADKEAYADALNEASAWLAARHAEEKPSPNAQRQAAYAARQREKGRKKYSWWMSPEEAEQVSELLRSLREKAELEPCGIRTCSQPERFRGKQADGTSHPHHSKTTERRTHR